MKSYAIIDGRSIPTMVEEMMNCDSIIEVEAGTNGYQGGGSGCGSRTYFRIKDLANTDMQCSVEHCGRNTDQASEVTITFGGDSELRMFIDGLRFALNTLEAKANRHSSCLRLTDDETGVLLQVLQAQIFKNPHGLFGSICQSIKNKLEGRYDV